MLYRFHHSVPLVNFLCELAFELPVQAPGHSSAGNGDRPIHCIQATNGSKKRSADRRIPKKTSSDASELLLCVNGCAVQVPAFDFAIETVETRVILSSSA